MTQLSEKTLPMMPLPVASSMMAVSSMLMFRQVQVDNCGRQTAMAAYDRGKKHHVSPRQEGGRLVGQQRTGRSFELKPYRAPPTLHRQVGSSQREREAESDTSQRESPTRRAAVVVD